MSAGVLTISKSAFPKSSQSLVSLKPVCNSIHFWSVVKRLHQVRPSCVHTLSFLHLVIFLYTFSLYSWYVNNVFVLSKTNALFPSSLWAGRCRILSTSIMVSVRSDVYMRIATSRMTIVHLHQVLHIPSMFFLGLVIVLNYLDVILAIIRVISSNHEALAQCFFHVGSTS